MTDVLSAEEPTSSSDGPWAVETHDLTKRFGKRTAVNGVDLLVPRGCAFGYLGPNGAGKTTLIRVLLGLTHADSGSMSLLGYSVPQPGNRPPAPASTRRLSGWAWPTAPTTRWLSTPWACASAWASPPACSETPNCSSSTSR